MGRGRASPGPRPSEPAARLSGRRRCGVRNVHRIFGVPDILPWLKVESSKFTASKCQLVGNDHVFAELVGRSKRARRRWDELNANDKRLVAAVTYPVFRHS